MLTETTAPEAAQSVRTCCCGRRVETIIFAVFLAIVMAVQIALSAPKLLLGRYFWQDEQFTYFIASDPSLEHMLKAVREGADTNPPIFHLLVRGFAKVVPGRPEVVYRLFIVLTAWLGLLAVYVILRRAFGILASAIGVLGLWASPLIMHETFDARFYIPLLACAAWFCLVLRWQCRAWMRDVAVVLAAALLCTIHYFGIIALVAIAVGELLLRGRQWRETGRRLLPALAGPIALAGMIPFLLGQRAGLSVATWVPTFHPDSLLDTFNNLFVTIPLGVVAIAWWLLRICGCGANQAGRAELKEMAGLAGLLLVPVAVVGLSVLVQPAMIPKYMIPAMLVLAPIMALLAEGTPCWARWGLVVILLGVGLLQLRHEAWMVEEPFELQTRRLIASCEKSISQGIPVVAASRREAYTLYYAAPATRGHVYIADIRPAIRGELGDDLMRHLMFETDFAAKYQKIYPVPPLIPVSRLAALGPFHLVGWEPWVEAIKRAAPLRHLRDEEYQVR